MKRDLDKYHLMKVFNAVALEGSFTNASISLNMNVSSVSKAVNQLEDVLGSRLLNRTTRKQSLTDAGRIYVEYSRKILADVASLEELITNTTDEPAGLLKVAAPVALGQFMLSNHLHEFASEHPKINVELTLSDDVVDLTQQGFDVAIRSKKVSQHTALYSILLGSHTRKLVASPRYLAKTQLPTDPNDLEQLNLLTYSNRSVISRWSFSHKGVEKSIEPSAYYSSNNYYALSRAVFNGMGVANLYRYMVDENINNGELVELLPHWQQTHRELYAVFQQRRESSPKLDAFLSFLRSLF